MKNVQLYLGCLALIGCLAYVNAEAKLKIGVKKRVENCTQKTRKGDLVHMHYTVSTHHRSHLCFISNAENSINYTNIYFHREHLRTAQSLTVAIRAVSHSHLPLVWDR